jgi:hypothetical protein
LKIACGDRISYSQLCAACELAYRTGNKAVMHAVMMITAVRERGCRALI